MYKLSRQSLTQKPVLFAAAALLLLLILVASAAHHSSKTNHKASQAATKALVSITAAGFVPSTLQISPGTEVVWTNNDSAAHQVASDPYPSEKNLPSLHSLALQPNQTYSYRFPSAGSFTYHDHLNPFSFKGVIVVH